MEKLKLKFPPVIQVFMFALFIWLVSKIYPTATFSLPSHLLAAIILVTIGGVIIVLGAIEFRKAHTTLDPRYPNNSSALVITGIYKYSRNPMYVGMFFSLFGVVLYIGNFPGLFVLPVFVWCMNELQIKWEEEALLDKFGDPYREYMGTVRRWL